MGEFELIERYFKRSERAASSSVALGIGDDCALLQPAAGMQLAVSTDMLVAGRHFFHNVDPRTLGHKALAVNLSDLAACGARPLAFTLALSLPDVNESWLKAFSEGLFALADEHACTLIGGDTTKGPLNICIAVFGELPTGQALLRSGACAGDDIYVSGTLGDANLALRTLLGELALPAEVLQKTRQRLEQPTPRIALGQALRGLASACADISDGLVGDLSHILKASGVGAAVNTPIAMQLVALSAVAKRAEGLFDLNISETDLLQSVLSGGDDYELVFTAAPSLRAEVSAASAASQTPVTRIGHIDAERGLRLVDGSGAVQDVAFAAFDHFAG